MKADKNKSSSQRNAKSAAKPGGASFKVNPREMFQMFRERWWIGAMLAVPAALAIFIFQPKSDTIYQTDVQLVFEPREDAILNITKVVQNAASPNELNNHMAQIRSKTFFEYVLSSFTQDEIKRIQEGYRDPEHPEAPLPSIAAIIRPNVSVGAQKGTTILGISVRNRNPECAALIANRYARRYIDFILDRLGSGTNSAIVFLRSQAEETRTQVEAAETALQAFRAKHNIAALGENQNVILQKVASLGSGLVGAEMQQVELGSVLTKIAEYRAAGKSLHEIPMVGAFPNLGALRTQLDTLKSERVLFSARYGKNHPKMKANELETEEVTRRLADVTEQAVRDIESRHRIAHQYENNLRDELAKAETQAHELDRISVDYRFLEQEAHTKRNTYNKIMERLNEAQISQQMESINIKLFDPASVPSQPISARPSQVIIQASLVGLGLLFGVPIILGYLDTRVKSVSHVEEGLHETLLGAVKRIKGLAEAERAHVFRNRGDNALGEAYRGIFSEIEIRSTAPYPKAVVVTSSMPGEGKSMTTSNLAAVFASHHRRTLLIDCDLRRPTLSKYFGVDGGVGLVQWVNAHVTNPQSAPDAPEGVITIDNGLSLLPAGGSVKNATEVLDQMIKSGLIQKLNTQYDILVFDTPPVGVFPDALLLCRVCAEAVYVCKFESIRIGHAKKLLTRIHDTGVHLLGVIMNQMPESRIKGYGYDSYGSYGTKYYKEYATPRASKT